MSRQPDTSVDPESTVLSVRRQGRVLTLPVLVLVAVAGLSGFFVGRFEQAWQNWAALCAAAAVALLLGVGPVLGWMTHRTTLTTRRVIVRSGFFVHRRSEIPLSRIREVRSRHGVIQRMFGAGDIELFAGPDAPTVLRDVPGALLLVDALQELIEQNFVRAGFTQEQAQAQAWLGAPGDGRQFEGGSFHVDPRGGSQASYRSDPNSQVADNTETTTLL